VEFGQALAVCFFQYIPKLMPEMSSGREVDQVGQELETTID
jgi:hypothetical protein